jgi:nitrite reductase/ring-hydroxylating ferredoxin subunit
MSFDVAASSSEARGGCEGCECGMVGAGQLQPISIDRRDFVIGAAAALAAVALAACSGDPTSPSSVSSTTFNLSDYPALSSVGGVATVSISGVPVAIVRTSSTSFAAFSRICPHQGATIDVTSNGFQCPRHGATFDKNGQWIGGQRTSNLTSYPVSYNAAAGTVTVGG